MPINPFEEGSKRFGHIAAGVMGAVGSFVVDVVVLVTGRTSGLGGRTHVYTSADSPSQFWFTVVLFALFGIAASWYAWYWYRE